MDYKDEKHGDHDVHPHTGNSSDHDVAIGEGGAITLDGRIVNASGHPDQLSRGYNFLSICGLALTVDNAWVALGTSLTLAIFNGGAPGILYELMAAGFYYSFIALSIAELVSAIPSAGGVYHWASLAAGPKHGVALGFFAGFVNWFGWLFDLASIANIMASLLTQMYVVYHPDFVIEAWHTFVAATLVIWLCILTTVFANRFLPYLQQFGLFIILVGGIVTIIVLAAMPAQHATTSAVWVEWDNQTGWSSGVAFLAGVVNGAFTIGTPDSVSHMSEEVPNPKRDLPKAVLLQVGLGWFFAFIYAIALLYGITDFDAVLNCNGSFPLGCAYQQATNGNQGATFGLLFIVFLSLVPCLIGTFLTVGRTFWALARDNATPFPKFFGNVTESLSCPIPATVLTGLFTNGLVAITLGSKTGFSALAGSFVVLATTSYVLVFIPQIITGRKYLPVGPFSLGKFGTPINAIASVLIIMFNIFYCFPFVMPVDVTTMNWNSVILVGVFVVTGIWWFAWGMWRYKGPSVTHMLALKENAKLSKV